MTSKEALEEIKRDGVFLNSNGEIDSKRTCECFSDYCNKIKQDLERLEQLEKVVEILKSKVTFWWRNDDILEIVKNPFLIKSPKIVIVTNYEEDKLLKEVLEE